ncbi:hypothetical protein TTHERM_01512210 (macronuclear) [Tetrahymena thermophila SB210]|uniref:Uncharacterized protein n=1 Tax=Tetrahymena thermophila (strain SB210) TaxID=312017 RepID=Q24CR0_TETTS|nr:hypothetical protein TTHERM_01512210 [Tetrahymena thermophila SB210]EAS05566.2 hypothetical protein TTHERM_01512210 [Tetrahymena thermophila SB210]|eukprot:XP_001025811.2 hypothetical protein TTHERM_01512210 [Tetrahymena thermophila SB210]
MENSQLLINYQIKLISIRNLLANKIKLQQKNKQKSYLLIKLISIDRQISRQKSIYIFQKIQQYLLKLNIKNIQLKKKIQNKMGNINNSRFNSSQIKYEIKQIVDSMNKLENKINKINKKFILNITSQLNPSCFTIKEKAIMILKAESRSSYFDQDELQYCLQQIVQKYQTDINKCLHELQSYVQRSYFYTQNCSAYQNNIEFLILKQYFKKFFQNEFQYQIIYESDENDQLLQSFEDFQQQSLQLYQYQQNMYTSQSFGEL